MKPPSLTAVIICPCSTQVELVWSKSVQKAGISAKTKRIGGTDLAASSIAATCSGEAPVEPMTRAGAPRAAAAWASATDAAGVVKSMTARETASASS